MQVSFPRSGRHLLQPMLGQVTGKRVVGVGNVNPEAFGDVLCFADHGGSWKVAPKNGKYILLVRDPRDVLLSYSMHMVWAKGGRKEITAEQGLGILDNEKFMSRWTWGWQDLLTIYQPLNTLVIYYERLLLYPDVELSRACDFLETPMVGDPLVVISELDCQKDDISKPRGYRKTSFLTPWDRYQVHCLKWQRCPAFLKRYVPRIWKRLGETMADHGYVKEGHSLRLLLPLGGAHEC